MASSASKDDRKGVKRPIASMKESNAEVGAMMLPSLYRLTEGLPRKELKLMVSEAMICEEVLEDEIRLLEDSLDDPDASAKENAEIQAMLDSEITPPDRFFTVSSLLGRLRDELATPLPPNSVIPALRAQSSLFPQKKKKKKKQDDGTQSTSTSPVPRMTTLDKQKQVLALYNNPLYSKEHPQPATLLTLWKRISSHSSSTVFRRPVNVKEAPGYAERVSFPMDLSLIRKMIIARQIKSYRDLHQRLGLIAHNCVKYNGRESDYGLVTRDFESNADEMVLAAVLAASAESRNPTPEPKAGTPTPPSAVTAPAPSSAAQSTTDTTTPKPPPATQSSDAKVPATTTA